MIFRTRYRFERAKPSKELNIVSEPDFVIQDLCKIPQISRMDDPSLLFFVVKLIICKFELLGRIQTFVDVAMNVCILQVFLMTNV